MGKYPLRLRKPQRVQLQFVVAPILADLDPALQVDLDAEQLLNIHPGGGGDFLSIWPPLPMIMPLWLLRSQ